MSNAVPTPKPSRSRRNDWDGAWKEAIQQLFPAFLQLLFPTVHALIDWSQEPVFLEQELRQVTRRAKRGKGVVDKLVRVLQHDGSHTTLLIHIDFQNQVDLALPLRLYTYNINIFALLKEPVLTLAVLGDRDAQWRPTEFRYTLGGFETRMRFPIAKLLDYEAKWELLEASVNPFAVIVMAHLKAMETLKRPETRLEWKLRLAKALYDRHFGTEQIQQLIDFIDWLMVLDDKREARFDAALRKHEEERTMPTLSPYQKRFIAQGKQEGLQAGLQEGLQEGLQAGLQEGLQEAVIDTLDLRFAPVPSDILETVQQIADRVLLKKLHRAAVQVADLEEFRSILNIEYLFFKEK